jgi:transcriptional regulator GlxA family with amidase domain
MVAFDAVQLLDVTGPLQVFATANETIARAGGAHPYTVRIVARQAPNVTASAGIILGTQSLSPPGSPVDTLIVAGGPGVKAAAEERELVGTEETMRRSFLRLLSTSPQDYRARFTP